MTWQPSRKTKRQRTAETRKRDKADSIACAERAGDRCEACGEWSGYDATSEFRGSMHHDYRKSTHPHLRHVTANHFWVCHHCHEWMHRNYRDGQEKCAEIRRNRGEKPIS